MTFSPRLHATAMLIRAALMSYLKRLAMQRTAVERRLLLLVHPIIPDHSSNPQPIVLKHLRSSFHLCIASAV